MSNPASQYKSTRAQGQGVGKNVKSKFSQAKAAKNKAAKLNKAVLMHLLLFLLFGVICGTTVFIPFYSAESISLLSVNFIGFSFISLLLGWLHNTRSIKKIDWFDEGKFFPRFLLGLCASFFLYVGMVLMFIFMPMIFSSMENSFSLAIVFLMASPSILVLVPFLLNETFQKAYQIEDKQYQLWEYPENYVEKQPTWDRDRIIYANLHFRRVEDQNLITTIKVKLPKEAIFGELIYLFMRDYNETRSPDNPIRQLNKKQGVEGWLFWTKNQGMGAITSKKRLIDTGLTVEENKILEDSHIYFERVLKEEQ